MSYEGYVQFICPQGHYWTEDCYQDRGECPKCGYAAIWENSVDITNGSFEGDERIDGYVELKIKKQDKCDKCNSILEETYHIPKNKGRKLV